MEELIKILEKINNQLEKIANNIEDMNTDDEKVFGLYSIKRNIDDIATGIHKIVKGKGYENK